MTNLDLGCGPNKRPEHYGLDLRQFPGIDVVGDLCTDWPFRNNSVDSIHASHIFEHLPDPLHTMGEAFRVLRPLGILHIEVPSSRGMGAFQDPTHKSFWNINSFLYYNRDIALGSLYNCNKWIVEHVQEYTVPGLEAFGPYVNAKLRKPGYANIKPN